MADKHMSISDAFDHIIEAADGDTVSIDDVLASFGRRAYGPILFVVGVISLSPIGSIPGASIFLATAIVLLMSQYIFRDAPPWLPSWIASRELGSKRARQAVETIKPYFQRVETVIRPRLHRFAEQPWTYASAVMAIAAALVMYPLALVPWGVVPPSLAIVLLGLGMMSSDGAVILCGLLTGVLTLGAAWYFLM